MTIYRFTAGVAGALVLITTSAAAQSYRDCPLCPQMITMAPRLFLSDGSPRRRPANPFASTNGNRRDRAREFTTKYSAAPSIPIV